MKISIIGTSRIVEEHIKAAKLNNIKIVAIFSPKKFSRNAKFIEKKYKVTVYNNINEFFNISKKKNSHYLIACRVKDNLKFVKLCSQFNKKIFIEKPVFLKANEFKKIKKYKNKIFIGFNRIFYKNIVFCKKFLRGMKNLEINSIIPEKNKERIISNASHFISILIYLFGNLKIIYLQKNKNCIYVRLKNKNKIFISITFYFKAIESFNMKILSKKFQIHFLNMEKMEIYNKLKKKIFKNNNIYELQKSFSYSEFDSNAVKPGFLSQMKEFKKFCITKKYTIYNNLAFAEKIIKLCNNFVK